MTTIPTDLLARLRAVLTAAEAMTPGPCLLRRFVDNTGNDAAAVIHAVSGETIATCDGEDRSDEARPVCDAAGLVALRNATADLAALLALVEAPVSVPTWTVEPFGDGLTRHTITRGRVRLTVRSGYDDGMAHGEIAIVYGPGREDVVRKSWFGGANRTAEESLADAKAGTLAMAREIGAVAEVEAPAGVEPTCACGSRLVGGVPGDAARFGWVCYECRLAKVELADGTPLTVGAAMPIGDALRSLAVLEWSDDNDWHQYDPVERGYRFRHRRALTWSPWRKSAAPKNVTVRLVPLTDADRDPNERGPL